jgi:CxxC motif-containing protein (DUF1111 family)
MSMAKKHTRVALAMLVGPALSLIVACEAEVTIPEAPPAAPELDESALHAQNPFHTSFARPAFGDPLRGLTTAELELFTAGKEGFEEVEEVEDGLGPVFNGASCVECHSVPATGGSSETLETRFGTSTAGLFDPRAELGGSLIQVKGIGRAGSCDFAGEVVPPEATIASGRRTTPLFGLGLVDAVPESTFRYVARYQASNFPREAGRVAMVHDIANNRRAVGRFGWKAQVPSLLQFSGDAYLNEMGITSPDFPDENCPQGRCDLLAACNPVPELNDDGDDVEEFLNFMRFLAPPPRGKWTVNVDDGRRKFSEAGCIRCHWATFRTGWSDSPVLSRVTFHPYSDFLLHDMGSLGDGVELGDAKGNEFRTAPLWGVRVMTSFLHDGRASTLDEAILAHDGQARRARDRFAALPARDQAAVIEFLNSL